MTDANTVLRARNLAKAYEEGPRSVNVLNGVDFDLRQGELVAIVGASGSGKSTLLHLLGGLDEPSSGEVLLGGKAFSAMNDKERARLRNRQLGFVYQFHHLLPEFSALENVAMPLLIRGEARSSALEKARLVLDKVGLSERLTHRPAELSGGERQRTAIARAVVTRPQCVLADEPTGNLDRRNAAQVFDLMIDLNREFGTSLILVTHDPLLAQRMDRSVTLVDGQIQTVE